MGLARQGGDRKGLAAIDFVAVCQSDDGAGRSLDNSSSSRLVDSREAECLIGAAACTYCL